MTMYKRSREELIVQEYRGILSYYEAFYIASIIYSAERSDAAFRRFEASVQNNGEALLAMATI